MSVTKPDENSTNADEKSKNRGAIALTVVGSVLAALTVPLAVWASLDPLRAELVWINARTLFPAATFFTVAAVIAWSRRGSTPSARWKDIARPVFACGTVLSSMFGVVHPVWGFCGVIFAGLGTWASVSGGFWDRSYRRADASDDAEMERSPDVAFGDGLAVNSEGGDGAAPREEA